MQRIPLSIVKNSQGFDASTHETLNPLPRTPRPNPARFEAPGREGFHAELVALLRYLAVGDPAGGGIGLADHHDPKAPRWAPVWRRGVSRFAKC